MFLKKNNLNEKSGFPIGSDREMCYIKELDSNKEIKEKTEREKQNKMNRFYG